MSRKFAFPFLLAAALAVPMGLAGGQAAADSSAIAYATQKLAHADAVTAQLGLRIARTGNTLSKVRRLARGLGLQKVKSYKRGKQTYEDWAGTAKLATGGTASAKLEVSTCPGSTATYFFALYLKGAAKADISALRARMNARRDLVDKSGARHVVAYSNPDEFRDGAVKKPGNFSYGFVVLDPPNNGVGQIQFKQNHYCKR